MPFVERVLKPNMMGKPTDEAAVAKALDTDLPPLFDYLEGEISGAYLVGRRLQHRRHLDRHRLLQLPAGQARIDAARWPKLAAYIDGDRWRARRSVAAQERARKG